MIGDQIEIVETLKKRRLIKKSWLISKLLDFIIRILVLGIPLVLAISLILYYFENQKHLLPVLFGLMIILILEIMLVYSYYNMNTLYSIEGIDFKKNREDFAGLIENMKWEINLEKSNYLLVHPTSFFGINRYREIVILFHDKEILINCISYGRFDIKIPLLDLINKRTLQYLEKRYIEMNNPSKTR